MADDDPAVSAAQGHAGLQRLPDGEAVPAVFSARMASAVHNGAGGELTVLAHNGTGLDAAAVTE